MNTNTDNKSPKIKIKTEMAKIAPEYVKQVQCDTTIWTQPFKCAVISCRHVFHKFDSNATFKYHNFPQDHELQKAWIKSCRLKNVFDVDSAKVCSEHFVQDDYDQFFMEDSSVKYKLKPSAVPTQFLEGVEVVVNFTNINEVPTKLEIRKAVDENFLLKHTYKKLVERKEQLLNQLNSIEKKITCKRKKRQIAEHQYDKLKNKVTIIKEQKNLLSRVFSQSQVRVLLGKKKVVWSNDDMAMAFTLRQMGNRECYLYLKKTLNIPLPSLSSVQKWAASK